MSDSNFGRIPLTTCPICHALLDDAESITEGNNTPSEGDFTVCLYCAGILRYTEKILLCKVNPEDLAELRKKSPKTYSDLLDAQRIAELYAQRRKKNPFIN